MKPLISIIVPVFNGEKTLDRCVKSILSQDFENFEVILIDDGSTDQSGSICDNYARLDERVRVIHQYNKGVSGARNAGIELVAGAYIAFFDSDDYVAPLYLRYYGGAAIQSKCDVVIGGYSKIEREKTEQFFPSKTGCFGNEIWGDICVNPAIYGYLWNKLFRTSIIKENQIRLREDMYSQEDLEFCLSVFGQSEKFCMIPVAEYQYDYTPGKRIPPIWDFISNQLKLLRTAQERTDLSEEAVKCVHERILSLLYTGLYAAAERGDFEDTVRRISCVSGLFEMLETVDRKGEHGFVAQQFATRKYSRLYRYFIIRNRIRDVVRAIRKRNP